MKNSILGKARWLREAALATSKNNGARVAHEWLKYAAVIVMLLTLGSGNAWGGSQSFNKDDFSSASSTKKPITVTFSAKPTINNQQIRFNSGSTVRFQSSAGNITGIAVTTNSSNAYIKNMGSTVTSGTWSGSNTNYSWSGNTTDITMTAGAACRITGITVTYTDGGGGGDCSECTYYVYNGSTWAEIGTTGFDDVVLAPPTVPGNAHGAGNGMWCTNKNKFSSCISYVNSNDEDYRFVPNPGGAEPDAENKPGSGTCALYAVYWDGGCLSTTVTAEPCARIWEEPKPNTPSVSGSDVTLSWSSVTGASGYHLYVTDGDSDVFNGDVNSTSKTLTGLAEGAYMWTVAANSSGGDACDSNPADGDLFEIVGCTDISGSTVSSANISITPAKTTATISWSAVANASSYEVKVYAGATASGVAVWTASPDPTSTSCTATGLTVNTQYTVAIKAKNACSTSSTAGTKTFMTQNLTLYHIDFVNQNNTSSHPAQLEQTSEGQNLDIPANSGGNVTAPSAACSSANWTFAGWTVGSALEETTVAPSLVAAGTTGYAMDGNKTFYAVFTKTEGGGGGVKTTLLTSDFEKDNEEDKWTHNTTYREAFDGSNTIRMGSGNYAGSITSTSLSAPVGTTITVACDLAVYSSDGTTVTIAVSDAGSASVDVSSYSTLTAVSKTFVTTTTTFTVTISTPAKKKRCYVDNIEIYYGGGGGGTTYWDSNPSCSNEATVTYHNDGAKSGDAPTDANNPYTIGNQVTVLGTGTMVAPDGKEFKCWNTAPDGKGTDYNIGYKFDIAGNMDFYPKWVNAPYTVRFDAEGGTCGTTSLTEASGGAGVTLPAATATCAPAGWSFYGWATSTCSSTTSAPSIVGTTGETYYPTGNITLHAVYKEGGYAIGTGSFAQVTGEANVVDGNFYLITNVNNANGMMYNTVTSAPRIGSTTNTYASCNDINCAWQMKKNGDYWQIYSPNKNLYAAGTGVASRATLMSDGTDDKTMWTLETTESGYYKFKNKYNTAQGVNAYLAYSAGNGYACMANDGSREVLYLYKAASGAVVAGTTTYNSNPTCETYEVTIGNHTNGTVAINGTTDSPQESLAAQKITLSATPESGYRFTGWTITKTTGGNDVTSTLLGANATTASTSFTMPDYDVTVSATFAAKVMYSITWNVNGSTYATGDPSTSAESGTKWSALTLPTDPADNTLSDCDRTKFVGWSTSPLFGDGHSAPSDLFKSTSDDNADSHTITSETTFYAVFAKGGGDGSWSVDGNNITATGSGTGYAKYNGDHELSGIGYKPSQVMPSRNNLQFQASAGYLYNTTAMPSDITSIVLAVNTLNVYEGTAAITSTGGLTPLSPTGSGPYTYTFSSGKRYFHLKEPDSGASVTTVTVNYEGTGTDYATQCCTLKPVTNLAVSSKTANSVTLTWTAPSPTSGIDHLELRNASTDAKIGSNIAVGTTTTTVGGLNECTTYSYKIVSVGAVCETPSNIVEATPFRGSKTVTFNYNGGTGTPASFTTSCGGTSTILPTPTRDGYTFLGWWTAADGGSKVGDAGANYDVATTTTIHAHWAQNFSITYDRVGGTDVCANETCGAGMTYTVCGTEPTKSGYIFAGWKDASTSVVYNAGDNFTMPAADVTLTAQWTANWRNLTFNVPAGGGSITGGPSGNHVLDNRTFTFPNITGKSDAKWCWTFLGWTETAPNGSGTWATTPSYIAGGATSGAITSDKTYYAVYSKTGAGASGDVYLTNEIITAKWADGGNAYGNSTTITAGGEWTYTGFGLKNNTYLQLKDGISTVYLKTPAAAGNITTITINYTAVSVDTRIIYCNTSNSTNGAVTHQFNYNAGDPVSGNHDVEIDVSSLESTSIYIGCNANIKFNSVSFHYGPRAVYGYTLDDCGCQVTQFNLRYNANSTTFPGSTISCSNEDNYVFASHGNEYTFCSAPTPPTGYRFLYWAENANGTGNHWEAGETVSCLPSADLTVYAFYERVYTVTFNDQGRVTPVTQASAGASVAVPDATDPCSGEWAFVGWSETAIAPMSFLPTLEITAGEGTYTPTTDKTLYAIYRKTSESSPFVAGMSGAYKIKATYNTTDYYAQACYNSKLPTTTTAGEGTVFYISYTNNDGGKYTIQQANGKYVANSGKTNDITLSDVPCYWSISKNDNLWSVQLTGGTYYLRYKDGMGIKAYSTNQNANYLSFIAAEGQYYYRRMSCAADFDVTFHDCGTTINWAGGYPEASYKNLADATVISTFPTATYSGWTFLGWRTTQYEESTDAPASSSIYGGSDGTSGNTLTIPSTNVDLYPVFTQFEDNEQIDLINGGDYYIYFLDENQTDEYGAYKRVYATSYSDKKRYSSTSVCSNATEFTFTKLANGNWTIYDKTTTQYLYGVAGDALKQQASATGAEWTLTLNGNEFDAFHVGTEYGQITAFGNGESATFMNYSRTNIGSNPSYHRVYLGTCTNRTFTYSPSNTPNIEIHGDVKVTSTAGKSVKATSVLTVSANNISTANLTVTSNNSAFKFSLIANGSYTTSVNIPVVSNRVAVTPVYIEYTPTIKTDGIEDAIITVSDGAGTPTTKSTADGDVQGRHLPTDFVIAAKIGNNWYALPADCSTSTSSTAGVLIEVDNLSDPTRATGAPMNTKYGLQPVRPGRVGDYGSRLVFTEHLSTAETDNQKTLYNGAATSIQVNAMYANYIDTNPNQYEWIPTTTDLKDYTLTSAKTFDGDAAARTVSLNTSGVFGTLLLAKAYDGKVRLLPATFYEPAEVQILKWKTNSVIVMYTGTEDAKTQVGANAESGSQELGSHKLTHGIYEFTTNQALTENAGQTLRITLGSSRLEVEIPLIIAGNTTAAADGKDVVILDGAKFTAAATKYNYRNVYVYGGGKLDIPTNTSLGVNNIILRAGGVTTNGSGGNATYAYVYPQVKLVGTLTSTQTNIKYEYVTDYDHWYHLCLPFNALTSTIQYPQEYYGSNVAADNHGSWVIKRYDGATRATGNYDAWVDIESNGEPTPTTVTAGNGYIFWGAPKKVSVGGGAATRQAWGIQRMTMAITSAAAATTAETNDKNISVDSYRNVNNPSNQDNDRGWNLVGNPYMVNLTGLSSESLIAGQLVHTETVPWDGKWRNNGDGVRYVTIPDNHFDSYVAKTASVASGDGDFMPGRAFFVQITEGASTLTFAAANRASLTPARFAQTAPSVDIETGIVMSDESKHDEVNFWIKEDKSAEYEYNADYPKTPNKTNFNIYGVHQSGNLSWVAISPAIAEGDMAIGYQVPAAGDYTLSLSEKYIAEEIESVFVTDHGVSPELTTDLMVNTYTFTVHQAETNNERFTVSIKVREEDNIATDIGNSTVDTHAVKFIRDDKMYILRNGLLYDATGKRVNGINK